VIYYILAVGVDRTVTKPGGSVAQRAATVICYLNNVAGGGATWFERSTGCPVSVIQDLDQSGHQQPPCDDLSNRPGVRE